MSDVDQMIASLEQQRAAIDEAIQALRNVSAAPASKRAGRPATKTGAPKKKRRLSPEGRRHIVEALKRRWAAKRAAQKAAAKK